MESSAALASSAAGVQAGGMDARFDVPPELLAWDGDVPRARQLQARLAARVRLQDAFPPLGHVAGVDVGFEEGGAVTRAAAVLLDADSMQPLAEAVARLPTRMPYLPGLLSFRELPAVLAALAQLPQVPDLVFVDGHGVAHPRGLGIAAHLGVITDLPTLGVAKKILVGRHDPVGPTRGDRQPLLHQGQVIGTVLRSKDGIQPLIVSAGHRVSQATAAELALAAGRGYKLPEPTRLADRIASRRDR